MGKRRLFFLIKNRGYVYGGKPIPFNKILGSFSKEETSFVYMALFVSLLFNIFDGNFPTPLIILITRNPIRDLGTRRACSFEYLHANTAEQRELLHRSFEKNLKEMLGQLCPRLARKCHLES